MYKTITSGDICEGSYLVLKQYRLERAKRLTGGAHVMLDSAFKVQVSYH